jgi:NitT/TauT family transport system ATP-binding protein
MSGGVQMNGARVEKVAIQRVGKVFPVQKGKPETFKVLEDITFTVAQSEVVAIIGGSGCGKTTLLRIINGLLRCDEGRIVVDGNTVARPGHDRGMVFQHSGLLPWRTAQANVEFGLELKGVGRRERTQTALRYLELVGLGDARNRYPHQLSGGMQQRIGLARALAIDPEVLLMDEPFGALDAQTKELLQGELLRIHEETQKTIIFVTHDLDEAVYLADRVVVLASRPGRVAEIVDVDIPRPRPEPAEVKANREFSEKRYHIWRTLKELNMPRHAA